MFVKHNVLQHHEGDLIAQDFDEAGAEGDRFGGLAAEVVVHGSCFESGRQGCMTRQDGHLAFGAGEGNRIDLLVEDEFFGGDDF